MTPSGKARMSTTTARRRLTTDEIALMRAIVMWRRELTNGSWPRVDFYEGEYHAGMGNYGRSVWYRIPEADDPADAYGVSQFANDRSEPHKTVEIPSLTEAVDVMATLGFQPAGLRRAF